MIRLTRHTDYALVLLTYFVRRPIEHVHNARDLAAISGLPMPTVGKILKLLTRAELLESVRGANGGYRLARVPGEISVIEIIRAIEGPVAMTDCVGGSPDGCTMEPHCPVTSNWHRINRAVVGALEGITLEEMARPQPVLAGAECGCSAAAIG
ncbi:SUF system Fe-S cluster assembly regulator [Candidatus Poribacteria bacterium]|nr:SUF system Fe-S cluster assembly regulator [Candidatus Poribacteria bacterium]